MRETNVRANLTNRDSCGITVFIDARTCDARRRYGIEQLLQIIGARWIGGVSAAPTVYYGSDPTIGGVAPVWIPVEPEAFCESPAVCGTQRVMEIDRVPIVYAEGMPSSLWTGNRLNFDLGAAAAFWLTLDGERGVKSRDPHGRVPGNLSIVAASGLMEKPPVHVYARLLADRLQECSGFEPVVPRWPGGKRYAVTLSHDVDAPERASHLPLLLKQLVFDRHRPRRHAYWDLRAELRTHGFANSFLEPPSRRLEWDFDEFCGLEAACGVRSTFFFGVANRRESHPCDIHYHCNRGRYRRLFRSLTAGGWEVGLQAGYLTRLGRPGVETQSRCLEDWSGCRISGVRHHYLQLDPEEPLRTLAAHAAAGMAYDSSVGFNDHRGFRAGIALPFHPFDPTSGRAASVVELPLTLADMHLCRREQSPTIAAVLDHLRAVRALGGLATLNWHVGNWYAASGWREGYRAACRLVATDPDAWVATANEVAAWWNQRAAALRSGVAAGAPCPAVA